MFTHASEAPLTEPIAVTDIFVSGLARIEDLGGNLRFTFYSHQRPANGGAHDMERVIVAKIVLSRDATVSAAVQALAAADTTIFNMTTN